MPLDFGTIAARGVQSAIQNQLPTIQANLANVPGMQQRLDLFRGQITDPMSQDEMAQLFGQQSALANLRGQAGSPAQILQNVFGVQDRQRQIQNQAAQMLGQATGGMELQAFQPGQGVSGALGAEQFNEQMAFQQAMQDRAAGRGPGGPSDLTKFTNNVLVPAAMGGLGAFAMGGLPGMGAAGAGAGAGAGGAGGLMQIGGGIPGMTSSSVPFMGGGGATMSPYQQAALRLSGFGAGANMGYNAFR